jgi:RNase adaptor protein for sRNA GlmZ degradation
MKQEPIKLELMSFGHKHGPVPEANLVIDVREIIPNPYRLPDPQMKWLTGLDDPVFDYVCSVARSFIDRLLIQVRALIDGPLSVNRCGKIAIGCKGGRQRSVALVRVLCNFITETYQDQVLLQVNHRDMALDLSLEPGRAAA